MNQDNPYASPTTGPADVVDAKLLRAVATHFAKARQRPPTVLRSLAKWPGTLRTLTIGVVGTALLAYLSANPDSAITSHWPLGFAAMIFGAVLRDLGFAIRVCRLWKPQSYFIDWKKVDEFMA
ncbi:MAG: hypothetical protein ABI614_27795 [Planctomycetota bacterium]